MNNLARNHNPFSFLFFSPAKRALEQSLDMERRLPQIPPKYNGITFSLIKRGEEKRGKPGACRINTIGIRACKITKKKKTNNTN